MFKKTLSLGLCVLLVALALTPVSAFARITEKVDYLALGDSLAAGQTPYKEIDDGYADFLAERLDESKYLKSFDKQYAVPGYTTEDVLEDIKDKLGIQKRIEEAEVITLDAGANDLLQELDITPTGVSMDPAKVPGLMKNVGENLAAILSEIEKLNPDAKVYVMGYYNAFPYLPKEQQEKLLPLMDLFNETIRGVVVTADATFVPTAEEMAEDFQTYLPNPQDIHPSEEGYEVLADQFWEEMVKEFPLKRLDAKKKVIHLKKGQDYQVVLLAVFESGGSTEVTDMAQWKSMNRNIATVKNGLITAKKVKGSTTIKAQLGKQTLTIYVKVK